MPDALLDQLLALPTEALCVLLVPGRHPHHAAHLLLAATESHQGAQQRVGINGLTRRARRSTWMLAGSITWLTTPSAFSFRSSQNPSYPAS
jgi:hypothetical protein